MSLNHRVRDESLPIFDVVIFGSGPAGHTAALYTARANLQPVVFEGNQPGGQLTITSDVDNFPGFPEGIMGPELMERMKAQCERFGTRYHFDAVEEVQLDAWPYYFQAGEHKGYARSIIIATGASAKYLGLPNEIRLRGQGVSACATCDAFFFRNQVVAVVGGGDSAAEESTYLTRFASKVYLLVRRGELRASKIMQQRVMENEKLEVLWYTEVADVQGADQVTGLVLRDTRDGSERDLTVNGLFLAIGHDPNSGPFRQWLAHDELGYLLTEGGTPRTKIPGVFAAGDVQDHVYRQAVTAAGSGCAAALEAERWLETTRHEVLEAGGRW